MKTERKQQSFFQGAFILTAATLLVKLIGALFKIPLTGLIGGTGMGYFSTAYDLYTPFYSLAMAGLPIAISRIVAERVAEKRFNDVNKTLKVAQRIFLITGATGTIILSIIVYPYAMYSGNKGAIFSMIAVIPALLFCCIMSSYRGFYEGMRNMYPTAISSVIEALGKLILGLGFAYLVIYKARTEYYSLGTVLGQPLDLSAIDLSLLNADESARAINNAIADSVGYLASAAAILGITIGSIFGTVFLIIYHKISGVKISQEEYDASPKAFTGKQTVKMIFVIAIPVVLGSLVTNFSSIIDLLTVQKRLATVVASSPDVFISQYAGLLPTGIDASSSTAQLVESIPNYLYGCYKGFGYSIFNLVPSLTSVLGVSALPVLATAWIEKDKKSIKTNIDSMIKLTSLVAMPAGVGIVALSGQLLNLLFSSKPDEVAISTPILAILGIAAILTGISVPLTNMLQAIGKQNIPVRNIAIGAVLKIVVNIVLVGIPSINILGAPIGTVVCYLYSFIANFYSLVKYAGVKLDYMNIIIKPLISAVLCGGAAWATTKVLSNIITSGKIVTVAAIMAAVVVYAAALLATRCVSKADLKLIKSGK